MVDGSGFRCVLLTVLLVGCCALWTPMSAEAEVILVGSEQYMSLQGHVYADLNDNSTLDIGEWIIPNVVIQCTVDTSQPVNQNPVPAATYTTTTDQYGFYSFTGLLPATYILTEIQPIEFMQGLPGKPGTLNGMPVGQAKGSDQYINITLRDGTPSNYDFGEGGLRSAYLSKRYLLSKQKDKVVEVPEPAGAVLLAIGSLLCLGLTGMTRILTRG